MMNNTSPTKGYTAQEIADAVPTLKPSTVYRILKESPQFVQTENSIHPKRYYFDATRIPRDKQVANSMQIRPEYRADDRSIHDTLKGLLDNLREEKGPLYKEVANIAQAANVSINFQTGKAPLTPTEWERAKYSIDVLEQFAATLYQRMYAIKTDERYGTPEWWAMFTKES
jgi:hypothetical protein